MILGIGTDLFEIERMKVRLEKQASFIDGIFTDHEISYCTQFKNKAQKFASRYAAKEAFLKALGTGWRDGITFKDIEISNNTLGKPAMILKGQAKKIADRLGVTDIQVSITNTQDLALAFVILTDNKLSADRLAKN